jgi:cell division protein FtsQ
MATIIPLSSERRKNRKQRRQQLKTKRTLTTLLAVLRTLLIVSFAGGAFWLLTLPNWVIRSSEQLKIEGNEFLSEAEVRTLIPLSYPQPLLTLSIPELKKKLKTKAPFEEIFIKREILPPEITIKVVERQPVAIALAPTFSDSSKKRTIIQVGYLDAHGILVPNEFYQTLKDREKIVPLLKIIGMPEQYLPYWQQLYPLVSQSEVEIKEINWQNPNNLILKTELGTIYLGAYTSQFPSQLMTLAKMKKLTHNFPPSQVSYIDLSDPDFPSLKPKQAPKIDKKVH